MINAVGNVNVKCAHNSFAFLRSTLAFHHHRHRQYRPMSRYIKQRQNGRLRGAHARSSQTQAHKMKMYNSIFPPIEHAMHFVCYMYTDTLICIGLQMALR